MERLVRMRTTLIRVIAVMALMLSVGAAFAPATSALDVTPCEDVVPGAPIAQECLALMESFPEPVVVQVPLDTLSLSTYSFWRVINLPANVHDTPNGAVIRQIPAGFHFVNVVDTSVEGWVQIEGGEWMSTSSVEFREASRFSGVQILNGLENQFAWALGDLYTSNVPGGPQDAENGRLLFRYDRINIFAEAYDDEGWRWYLVGPDQWIEQRMVSKVFRIDPPEGVTGRWVAIDIYEQTLVAYEDETPVFATVIATGLPGTDTNEGLFTVWASLERDRMSGFVGAPTAYDLQGVPWVMYFDDAISLHGTYWHDDFGYRRSRGCVNLTISDARFLYRWFEGTEPDDSGQIVNHVYVWASGEYSTTGAATR